MTIHMRYDSSYLNLPHNGSLPRGGGVGWGQGYKFEKTYTFAWFGKSSIDSFSFRMRYRDQTLLDTRKNYAQYKREIEMLPNPWIRVGIASGTRYHQGEHVWDRYIASDFERGYSSDSPVYQRDGDDYEFGLERYIVPGINPANNLPWRENHSADDVFVHRDAAGHVNAYIRCSNNAVPHPPCSHYFSVSGDMKVDASLLYDRQLLPDWQFCAAAVGNPGWCGGDEFVKACHVWSPWGERGGIVVKKPRRSGVLSCARYAQ